MPLRGKILNVLGAASSKLTQNQEINDLCEALGVRMGAKFNVDDLRYDKVIIMTDADVDGAHIASLLMTFFKGLGEMDAKDLKETTMDPKSRTLIRVTIDEDVAGETGDLVERLMGKKAEERFLYIQEHARFVEELDV